jgi:hypothetical protein
VVCIAQYERGINVRAQLALVDGFHAGGCAHGHKQWRGGRLATEVHQPGTGSGFGVCCFDIVFHPCKGRFFAFIGACSFGLSN